MAVVGEARLAGFATKFSSHVHGTQFEDSFDGVLRDGPYLILIYDF